MLKIVLFNIKIHFFKNRYTLKKNQLLTTKYLLWKN